MVSISWRLVSRGYQATGLLKIEVKPNIEKFEYIEWVEHPNEFTTKTVFVDKYQY